MDETPPRDKQPAAQPAQPEPSVAQRAETGQAESVRAIQPGHTEEPPEIVLELGDEDDEDVTEPERKIIFNEYNEPVDPPANHRETRRVIWYMHKRGCPLTQIADYLALERVPTFTGRGAWHPEKVAKVIKVLEKRVATQKEKRLEDTKGQPNAMDELIG